jgi:hypothetical protein
MKKRVLTGAIAAGVAAIGCLGQMGSAEALSFTGTSNNPASSNNLSAIADFQIVGTNLQIVLTNTGDLATRPSDALTAIFWDMGGTPILTYSTGTAPTVTRFSPSSSQSNVNLRNVGGNEEWRYAFNSTNLLGLTQSYGLGTAGFGVFSGGGGGQQFQYGIVNGVGNSANNPVKAAFFVNNTATFSLSGVPVNFDLSSISNVRFQYGTNLDAPNFPGVTDPTAVPTPALLPALAGMGLAAVRRRKQAQESGSET